MGDVIEELKKEGLFYGENAGTGAATAEEGEKKRDKKSKDKKEKKEKSEKKDKKKKDKKKKADSSDESDWSRFIVAQASTVYYFMFGDFCSRLTELNYLFKLTKNKR